MVGRDVTVRFARRIPLMVLAREGSRALTVGLLSGAAAGLVAGVGARLAMRLVALAGDVTPAFTVGGTLTVLVTGLLYGIGGGVLYVAVRGRLPGTGAGGGLTFGLLVLLLFGPVYFLADQVGELHVAPVVGILTFAPLFVLGGTIIGAIAERLAQRWGTNHTRAPAVGFRALGVLGLLVAIGSAPAIAWQVGLAIRKAAAMLAGP
jgi:hypothetical protein